MESPSLNISKQQVLEVGDQVADDLAVKGDYGLEYSVVAVGFAGMLGRKDDITALVADEDIHHTERSDEPFRSGILWCGRIHEYRTHGLSTFP